MGLIVAKRKPFKLTKTSVAKLTTTKPGGERFSDSVLPGFGVRVHPTGRAVYFIRFGPRDHRQIMNLGTVDEITPEDAREEGREVLKAYRKGEDPRVEQEAALTTFAGWVDHYLAGVRDRKKDPRPDLRYLGIAKARWKHHTLKQVTRTEIKSALKAVLVAGQRRHQDRLTKARGEDHAARVKRLEAINRPGYTQANRWLASIRACLAEALLDGKITTNPALTVPLYRENPPRNKVLKDAAMKRFIDAINAEPDPFIRAAFKLLVETGARTSEVLRARWVDFDLDSATWIIPSTKAGDPQPVALAAQTVGMLRRLPHPGPYVIPGRADDKPRTDLKRPWERIRTAARLPADVHIHDLRRTFGLKVAKDAGLWVASKVLRHSDVRVTQKVYAPLGVDDIRDAVERAQRSTDKVVPIRKRG